MTRRRRLGPCRCQGCGVSVWWSADAWRDASGEPHRCAVVA